MACEHLQPLLESDKESGQLCQGANLLASGHVPRTALQNSPKGPGHSSEECRWRCHKDKRCSPKKIGHCETVRIVHREGDRRELTDLDPSATKKNYGRMRTEKHRENRAAHQPMSQHVRPTQQQRKCVVIGARECGNSNMVEVTARSACHCRAPPETPRLFRASAHQLCLAARFRPRQLSDESLRLARVSSHLRWRADSAATPSCCAALRLANPSPAGHDQRCVDCKLSAPQKRKPVSDNFQPPAIIHVRSHQIEVYHVGVTLPPASRQIRAAAFSTAHPLPPNTPDRAQTAR